MHATILPPLLILLLILHLTPRTFASTPLKDFTKGLTYESCNTNNDCRANRICASTNGRDGCRQELESGCACVPPSFTICTATAGCPRGEICGRFQDSPFICVSAGLEPGPEAITVPINESIYSRQCPPPMDAAPANGSALSYDSCTQSNDCAGDRQCYDVRSRGCCDSDSPAACACIPRRFTGCGRNGDCQDGEECVKTRIDSPRCISSKARDEFDAEKVFTRICVDARALAHLPSHRLVYPEHRRARVLCDAQGSCATPGHIVNWQGAGVMMRSYCKQVGCVPRVMLVNSPRYQRALTVKSNTGGLDYTAFAARYESVVEERLLSTAVRLGL